MLNPDTLDVRDADEAAPIPPTCETCTRFQPRDPARPWPIAGIPKTAEGKCDKWKAWRNRTDWCQSHTPPAPKKPKDAQ